jgi:hypothetical protein
MMTHLIDANLGTVLYSKESEISHNEEGKENWERVSERESKMEGKRLRDNMKTIMNTIE